MSLDSAWDVMVTGPSEALAGVVEWATLAYDPSGALLWSARHTAPGDAGPRAIAAAGVLRACVSGVSPGETSGADALTIEYGPDARPLWEDRFDGAASGDERARTIAVACSGATVVAGTASHLLTAHIVNVEDVLVQSYDQGGALLWTYRYDSPGHLDDVPLSTAIGADGVTYVTATAGTLVLDREGRELWVDPTFPGIVVAVAPSGDIFIAGRSPDSAPVKKFNLVRYAPDGRKAWISTYGVQGESWSLMHMALDSAGKWPGVRTST